MPTTGWRAPGFLKLFLCGCLFVNVFMCVFVCVSAPKAIIITSGMMWRDMDLIRLVKLVLKLLYGDCSRYC